MICLFVAMLLPMLSHAGDDCYMDMNYSKFSAMNAGENPSTWFSVNGYSFKGEYLVITYTIRYPGMTKVKLFGDDQKLLWRGQYVNDKEGEHRLILRKNRLTGSAYTFEFDYKNQKQSFEITM